MAQRQHPPIAAGAHLAAIIAAALSLPSLPLHAQVCAQVDSNGKQIIAVGGRTPHGANGSSLAAGNVFGSIKEGYEFNGAARDASEARIPSAVSNNDSASDQGTHPLIRTAHISGGRAPASLLPGTSASELLHTPDLTVGLATAVPEPSTLAMFWVGMATLIGRSLYRASRDG